MNECVCGQYRMILDVTETFQFNALQNKAFMYRPYDGALSVAERFVLYIYALQLATHADDSRRSIAFSGVSLCVSCSPQHNSKSNDPKGSDLGYEMTLGCPRSLGLKGQRSQVAGVCLHLCRMFIL